MRHAWEADADVVVLGTGVAGLTAALEMQAYGLRVLAVSKGEVADGSTRWAQGGVAVVLPGTEDSVDSHVMDTLVAGAGLCDEMAVRAILADGLAAVEWLRSLGATFDATATGQLARTREGGHGAFRVIHANGDGTGEEVARALCAAGRTHRTPVLELQAAIDILTDEAGRVAGVALLAPDGRLAMLHAPAVVLATGGSGHLYATTSNPDVATSDGIALALRAGALAGDLEFLQFHPTVLYTGPTATGRRPLITEALRGEGAVLVDAAGAPVMAGEHPLADLAPRDVVSAVVMRRMRQSGTSHVYLDATGLGSALPHRFPTVYAACRAAGLRIERDPIPVAPAAHYHCGGVLTDVDGRTSVPGLYAAGEVARTGLHGANRLGSNSLLEGLVVGRRVARSVRFELDVRRVGPAVTAMLSAPTANRIELQQAMTRWAGIGRDDDGLAAAYATVEKISAPRPLRSRADAEDAALTVTARALLFAARIRQESRGCHLRHDFPDSGDRWRRTVAVRLNSVGEPVEDDRALAGSVR